VGGPAQRGDRWKPDLNSKKVNHKRLGHIAEAQGVFARHEAQASFGALYESYIANSMQGRSAHARLLSCACRPASAWFDTLPCTPSLELKIREVRTSLHHRLGHSMLPSNTPAMQCDLGATLRPTEADHGMRCTSVSAHTTLCHDILKGILRRVVLRAGIAFTQEPAVRRLPGLAEGAGTSATGASTHIEAREDILLALPGGITIGDITITHPLAIDTLAAAATMAGAAAARRDQQ
jgi:hypothetical protein